MRRKDREMPEEFAWEVADRCPWMVLSMTGPEGQPYCVPLSMAREGRSFYFHCAREGRKLDILQNRPEVSFEMDGDHVLLEGDMPCRYSYAYGCVMGRGVVEFLREDEEKMHALRRIMLHQTGRDADFTPGMVRSVCVLRLKVEAVSAKLHACPEPPPSR